MIEEGHAEADYNETFQPPTATPPLLPTGGTRAVPKEAPSSNPLVCASMLGQLENLMALLEQGDADPDFPDVLGRTALGTATQPEIIYVLQTARMLRLLLEGLEEGRPLNMDSLVRRHAEGHRSSVRLGSPLGAVPHTRLSASIASSPAPARVPLPPLARAPGLLLDERRQVLLGGLREAVFERRLDLTPPPDMRGSTLVEALHMRGFVWRVLLGVSPEVAPSSLPCLVLQADHAASPIQEANLSGLLTLYRSRQESYTAMKTLWKERGGSFDPEYTRIIWQDCLRTDRELDFYRDEKGPGLRMLNDILLTYCETNRKIGYSQGMSDLLAPILYLVRDEVESFWTFSAAMDRLNAHFDQTQSGVSEEMGQVFALLGMASRTFAGYVERLEAREGPPQEGVMPMKYQTCFRSMMLLFKRELSFQQVGPPFPGGALMAATPLPAPGAPPTHHAPGWVGSCGAPPQTMQLWDMLWTGYLSPRFHVFVCLALLLQEAPKMMERGMTFIDMTCHLQVGPASRLPPLLALPDPLIRRCILRRGLVLLISPSSLSHRSVGQGLAGHLDLGSLLSQAEEHFHHLKRYATRADAPLWKLRDLFTGTRSR
ncbi:putative TBC1 domain family member 15 [Paratrimastix pyriformis]|uniref:TBC1 domain family member 15 n=1 Tax=Paratrimastix pyriformis TaxID=342808 RepID=A0ABQ8UKA1_9EUKA|nr:putative TBC1 domain family member 15 [Paratrimastix pyriformis]